MTTPKDHDELDIRQTEIAIKRIKELFEQELSDRLMLTRVSAPLFVSSNTGLNDDLNGTERPVSFNTRSLGDEQLEVVHSLAKWKRQALARYGFGEGEGLLTDMNAIRRDEELGPLHSMYVDQWDWEVAIPKHQRTLEFLKATVGQIYVAIRATALRLSWRWLHLKPTLPNDIVFITTQELEDRWPDLTPKEREDRICKEHGAVFIMEIGGKLASGNRHDGRAPDYDDWQLNGDIVVWNSVLNRAFELSSMGIRVDEDTLMYQLQETYSMSRLDLPFHQQLIKGELPYSIGGGIGQSRLCMFLLGKRHIGEVQASVWPPDMIAECEEQGIRLL